MSSNTGTGSPPLCAHHVPTVRRIVNKPDSGNIGRAFYVCNQVPKCNTYIWEDGRPSIPYNPAAAPSSSQPPPSSQPMSQNSYGSQNQFTPNRKRTASYDDADADADDVKSPFDMSARQTNFSQNKRVKVEAGVSSLGPAWAPPSPHTPTAPPSASQSTVTSTTGHDNDFTADTLEQILSRLHELPAYLKKLERKRIAAEKSSEVKSKKIAELQAEVERLKAREQELEEVISELR